MPSTRTGRRYSAGPSMPSSSTLRRGSYVSSPSSRTSNSVLRSVSPYQRQERIPDITQQEYGRILDDEEDYVNLMATLYPQSDLYSSNHATTINHSTEYKKRSRQVRRRRMKDIHRDGRIRTTTGTTSTSNITIPQTLYTNTYSVLSCTKSGSEIPYPPTDVTTTRDTRKPDHH